MREHTAILPHHPLDTPILQLARDCSLSIRQAFEGVQIFGGTGSGKTSGSGRTLAHGFLQLGFGGLVLCAKPDEANNWRRYAVETGREDSFLFIDGSPGQGFNFLEYEMKAYQHEGNQVNNAVETFMQIMKAANHSENRQDNSPFWDNSVRDLLRACLTALHMAYGGASLDQVFRMAITAHTDERQLQDANWLANSYCSQTLQLAIARGNNADAHALKVYFRHVWGGMDTRLKSNIIATLSSLCGSFMLGRLREMFCGRTSFVPEMAHYGAVIVLDMPVKTWQQDGIIAQHIIKYAFQRATERRGQIGGNVFLWVDEAQLMLSDYDSEFQSTARNSRAATVYLTQNINMYHRAIGGTNPHYAVRGLLGNLKTKIFHANDDVDTNKYAAELIGTKLHLRRSGNVGGNQSTSYGTNNSRAYGNSYSVSESQNTSYSEGESDSVSRGRNSSQSNNYASGYTASSGTNGTSSSSSGTFSNGRTSGTHQSNSHTTSHNHTQGQSYSASYSGSETYTAGQSHNLSRGQSWSDGYSEQKDLLVEPHLFRTGLTTGGPEHNFIVSAILVQSGFGTPQCDLVYFQQG
jgi:hypothetical protein